MAALGSLGRQRLDLMAVVPEGQSPPPRRERLLSKDGFNRSTQQSHKIVVLAFRSPASYRRLEKDLDPIRSYVFPGRSDIKANPCSHVQNVQGSTQTRQSRITDKAARRFDSAK